VGMQRDGQGLRLRVVATLGHAASAAHELDESADILRARASVSIVSRWR
jgi:hypothetical protein